MPLSARLVEVIADYGEAANRDRYRYGSGCQVAGRTVLTAAHVVAGAVSVAIRGPDKVEHRAALDPAFVGVTVGGGPDLALIEITDSDVPSLPRMGLAAVDRDSPAGEPVKECHAIGYPKFRQQETADGRSYRETVDAPGQVPVLSGLAGGLLSVQVLNSPQPLPRAEVALGDSPWAGISGGPVVANGYLLAVVTEHAPREGSSSITATPLTALEHDPAHPRWGPGVANPHAWWARLRVPGIAGLKTLPAKPEGPAPDLRLRRFYGERLVAGGVQMLAILDQAGDESGVAAEHRRARSSCADAPYWATVREIRQRTKALTGRQPELERIASFAVGAEKYKWLVGDAWAGKTALLAETAVALSGSVDVVCYFLSRREGDADSARFLAAVIPQLENLVGPEEMALGSELHRFRALWQRAAQRADDDNRNLLLIVDGLDEDLRPPGLPSVAALLPAITSPRAHVVVSSRPHPELPSDIAVNHPLTHVRPVAVWPFSGAQELQGLARQEIDDLIRRDDHGFAADLLGLLTAARGPLSVQDLCAMTADTPCSASLTRRIRYVLTETAARSLQPIGSSPGTRYQFAHESLLAYAQSNGDLNHAEFHGRIHLWAETWRAAGWPAMRHGDKGTPAYLLDTYASTLADEPRRLAALVTDVGWIEAAMPVVGEHQVRADLERAAAADPHNKAVSSMLATFSGYSEWTDVKPDHLLQRLFLRASEYSESHLAEELSAKLRMRTKVGLVPLRTGLHATKVLPAYRSLYDKEEVNAVAALHDGRVVTGTADGRLLVWDLSPRAGDPLEQGRIHDSIEAVAVLPDGRVVTGSADGQLLLWDPRSRAGPPVDLGRHDIHLRTVAVLPDGRVVTGGRYGAVRIWDAIPDSLNRIELGGKNSGAAAIAVLPDGRLIIGGERIRLWDPAPATRSIDDLGSYGVSTIAVLPSGLVVAGNSGRLLVLNPSQAFEQIAELPCRVTGLCPVYNHNEESCLAVVHGTGLSFWSIKM